MGLPNLQRIGKSAHMAALTTPRKMHCPTGGECIGRLAKPRRIVCQRDLQKSDGGPNIY
jgi:hypothetical protein